MTDVILGELVSRIVEDHSLEVTEGGFFTLSVTGDLNQIKADPDPRGRVNKIIGMHLASAIIDTQLPQDKWAFESSKWLQRNLNYPEVILIGGKKG